MQTIRKFDLHFLYFWSSISQSTYCQEWLVYARNCYVFTQCLLKWREIHRTQDTEHLNRGPRIPLLNYLHHMLWCTRVEACAAKMLKTIRPWLIYNIPSPEVSLIWSNLTVQKQAWTTCFDVDAFNTIVSSSKWVSLCLFYAQFSHSNRWRKDGLERESE